VVCLQEVWQHEGFDTHQLEPLTAASWDHRIFAKNVDFRRGAQGNAVLSRLPVASWSNFDISIARREPRGILHTLIDLPGHDQKLSVFCIHFGLKRSERRRQALLLKQFVDRHVSPSAPAVFAGDFNDWRGDLDAFFQSDLRAQEVMREASGHRARTYPAYWPLIPLDRIYYRNCRLAWARVVSDRRCLSLSDHLPVEAVFQLLN
jgi:endonuclease/exonuclease/phosphatase family metal-dependent hydrolase